jgi:sugar phosphate isomerase/epimerase
VEKQISFALFTKPWKDRSAAELAHLAAGFGFDGIELPVRNGFQVEPAAALKKLPQFAAAFAENGLNIYSVAASPEEPIFAACAEAGVPLIRTMIDIGQDGYTATEKRVIKWLEDTIVPLCNTYKVKVGIQQHHGKYIADGSGLMRIIGSLAPEHVGAIWDAAHDALAGQQPEYGLDIVWPHLAMVNLKNAYWFRNNGPEADRAEWNRHFTTGRHGMASWTRTAEYLKGRHYSGVVCLTAQYTDDWNTERYVAEDLAYAKALFGKEG